MQFLKFFIFFILLFMYSCANQSTDGICIDNPCKENHKTVCKPTSSSYTCSCDPGYKNRNDDCVEDNGSDICFPNPCKEENRNICNSDNDIPVCLCNDGFLLEDNICVDNSDNKCGEVYCSANSSCENNSCICEDDYEGVSCNSYLIEFGPPHWNIGNTIIVINIESKIGVIIVAAKCNPVIIIIIDADEIKIFLIFIIFLLN